jgi:hypothetical protein
MAAVESPQSAATGQPAPTTAQRDETFKKLVTNVRLVGNFTIDGDTDPGKLRREPYAITGAMKLGNGDLWALTSQIKYGDVDLMLPVDISASAHQDYVEDCPVCCHPKSLHVEIGDDGEARVERRARVGWRGGQAGGIEEIATPNLRKAGSDADKITGCAHSKPANNRRPEYGQGQQLAGE